MHEEGHQEKSGTNQNVSQNVGDARNQEGTRLLVSRLRSGSESSQKISHLVGKLDLVYRPNVQIVPFGVAVLKETSMGSGNLASLASVEQHVCSATGSVGQHDGRQTLDVHSGFVGCVSKSQHHGNLQGCQF